MANVRSVLKKIRDRFRGARSKDTSTVPSANGSKCSVPHDDNTMSSRSETSGAAPKLPEDHSPEPRPPVVQSLWDRAYDALKKSQEKLVTEYEDLLLKEAQTTCAALDNDSHDSRPRRAQLDAVVEQGLRRMDEKQMKYKIAGHEVDVTEQISNAASFVLWAKGLVSEGVKASPEASIAWAGICIILPLLTNPITAAQANSGGFVYVTTRLRFYTALEPQLERLGRKDEVSKALFDETTVQLVDLYQRILAFQLQSILRFFRGRLKTYANDVFLPKDWKQMCDDIKSRGETIYRDMTQMNGSMALQELMLLNTTSTDQLNTLQELLDFSKKSLETSQNVERQRLSDDRNKCLQLFYLTQNADKGTYESFKGRVERRLDGTCRWFLENNVFRKWLVQESGPLLVSADPGCGKSVLAKSLLDNELRHQAVTVCYFFFKDQVQNMIYQALCALLHQLFSQKPDLIQHAMELFKSKGAGLVYSTESLWTILGHAVRDPRAGQVTIVLDALDECSQSKPEPGSKSGFDSLMQEMGKLVSRDKCPKLKVFMTTRPYEQIMSKFRGCFGDSEPIHIPGQESSHVISEEVNLVIQDRAKKLAQDKQLPGEVVDCLKQKLLAVPHRTYLWVYLVFDYLRTAYFKKTKKGVNKVLGVLPTTVNDAYEKILEKAEEAETVRKILCIILAATRPLTLQEMNVAVGMSENIDENAGKSLKPPAIDDLDLEDEKHFESRLQKLCGLFVSVYQGSIFFLHQTAREFLLAADLSTGSAATISPGPPWKQSIGILDAHAFVTKICVLYLLLFDSDTSSLRDKDSYRALLSYSARYWTTHFRDANTADSDAIVPIALRLHTSVPLCSGWIKGYWRAVYGDNSPGMFTGLLSASFYGQGCFVGLLLDGADVEMKDSSCGRTPLSWAAGNGYDAVVKQLLDHGADVETKDRYGQAPLSWAAGNGRDAVVKQLLDHGADVETKDECNRTPLSWAVENGRDAVVKQLLDHGADVETKDSSYGRTPLSWAARNGRDAVVKQLLDHGADVETKDECNRTPLSWAAKNGHDAVVKQLLDYGAR